MPSFFNFSENIRLPSLCWCVIILLALSVTWPNNCCAQPSRLSLNHVGNQVNSEARATKIDPSLLKLSPASHSSLEARNSQRRLSNSALQLDSVEAILSSDNHDSIWSYYRGTIYTKYFRDWTGVALYDDDESSSFAEYMLLHQATATISEFLHQSPLSELFKKTTTAIKHYKKYTTIDVAKSGNGKIAVDSGGSTQKTGKSIFSLKLSVNADSGIEPRLIIEPGLSLRYDVLREKSLLEYHVDF